MPDEPYVGFVVVAVIFVSATLLGFASHSPGGLGVFDAAMLYGILHFDKQFDKEELLAGMLLFRVLYYLVPFVISVILLLSREVIVGARARRITAGLKKLDDVPARHSP
jgi:glycosyltransferase 2 family protein